MSRSTQNAVRKRTIFIENLQLDAFIGAYDHEQGEAQRVRIDIEVDVAVPNDPLSDHLEDVLCYNKLTQGVKAIIDKGHIKLVETLAERIATLATAHDLARAARVRVSKPGALEEAEHAGVMVTFEKA